MKKVLLLVIMATSTVFIVSAQQKKRVHNLLISIYDEDFGLSKTHVKVIITKDDGSQEERDFKIRAESYQSRNIKEKEDSLMQTLKPYFDDGWKLVSTASITIPNSGNNILNRFFLRKEDE